MKKIRWRLLVQLLLVAGAAGTLTAQQDPTLWVDRDSFECPHAEFRSIQAAVDAAAPGATIVVCPDLYMESVTVPKTLTLKAHRPELNGRSDCFNPTPDAPDPQREAIVDGDQYSFSLEATGIVLEGFVIQGAVIGVLTSPAFSGYRILENVLQNNVLFGIDLNANGTDRSVVKHNCLRFNDEGVASETGDLRNAEVSHNESFRNRAGFDASGPGSREAVHFENNVLRENGGGIILSNSTGSTIAHNSIDAAGASIISGGGNVGLTIEHNVMEGGRRGIIFCVLCTLPPVLEPSRQAEVRHNEVARKVFSGIHVFAGENLVDSRITHNSGTDNGQDGIRIEAGGNAGNLIEGNRLEANAKHDCHDDTVGTGTGGTANTWVMNRGFTENRPGLCAP